MKNSIRTTLSIAGVLVAAGSAFAVNASVLSSPSLETIGSTETAAVIVPHVKSVTESSSETPSASDATNDQPASSASNGGEVDQDEAAVPMGVAAAGDAFEEDDEGEDEDETDAEDVEDEAVEEEQEYGDDDD